MEATMPIAVMRTSRGRDVLVAVDAYWRRHGLPPSFREVGAATGITSTYMVRYWLARLAEEGLIDRGPPGAVRSVRMTTAGQEALRGMAV